MKQKNSKNHLYANQQKGVCMQRKNLVKWSVFLICISLASGIVIGYSAVPSSTTWLQSGSLSASADRVMWVDGSTYFIKNGETGQITSSTNASYLITTALTTLASDGGGKIYLKRSDYDCDSPIIFPSTIATGNGRQRLEIISDGAVLSFDASITDDLIQVDASSATAYYGIKLQGFEVWQQAQDKNYYCLTMDSTFYSFIEDMTFGWGGVKLRNATTTWISNTQVVDSVNEGLNFYGVNYCWINNLLLDNCGGWGGNSYVSWLIDYSQRIYAENFNMFGGKATYGGQAQGLYIYDSSNCHFNNFEIDGFKNNPISIAGEYGLSFSNFNIKGSDVTCIAVSPTTENIYDIEFDNFKLNIDTANQYGISVYGKSTYDVNNVKISNGIIQGSSGNEIAIYINDDGTGTGGNVTITDVTAYDLNYGFVESSNGDFNTVTGFYGIPVFNGILVSGSHTRVLNSYNYTTFVRFYNSTVLETG